MGQILVVDDDEIAGIGAQIVLTRIGFDAAETDWRGLPERSATMSNVDVLLAVVRRDTTNWDRYRSLHEAGDLRSRVQVNTRIVAVVEASDATNPLLGLRLQAMGVDDVVTMRHMQSVERIAAVAAGEMVGTAPRPAREALAPVFVGPRSNPAGVISLIAQLAQRDPAYLRAFTPGLTQNQSGLTRRRAHTLRVKVAKLGDLSPDPSRRTGGPVRDESLPRWSQMVPFVNQIRGWCPSDDVLELADERGTSGPLPSARPTLHRVV